MASPTAPSWSQPDSLDSMAAMGEHEFASFLDLDLDLNFSGYGADQSGPDSHLKRSDHNAQHQPQHLAASQNEATSNGSAMFDFDMPMAFDQAQDMQFSVSQGNHPAHVQSMIPPTPNSVEMHGDTVRYLQHLEAQNRALLEEQYQMKKANTVCTAHYCS
jgi:hypothetical protein